MTKTLDRIVEHASTEELGQILAAREFAFSDLDTALHVAVRLGLVPAIRVLVSAGASVEAYTKHGGWKPLHTAVEHGQLDAIRELSALGANVNSKADEGVTPLHLAVDAAVDSFEQVGATDSLPVVSLLLDLGADCEAQDDSGSTPKGWAEEAGMEALAALLS